MFSSVTMGTLVKWSAGMPSSAVDLGKFVQAISTDTRTLQSGDVYVALRGESYDGHTFISEALQKGAVAIISEKFLAKELPFIQVTNSLKALVAIGSGQRALFHGTVVGVTGSAGKSSTKEMIATLLGPHTIASPASYNNLIGLSKTLCLVNNNTRSLVLEIGMNLPGEITELCRHFRPEIGMVTNIGDAHLGKLGSREAIYRAKKELFDFLAIIDCRGVALNVDDQWVMQAYLASNCHPHEVVRYSIYAEAPGVDVRVMTSRLDPKTAFLDVQLENDRTHLSCKLPVFGVHHVQNLAAAISIARLCGISATDIQSRLPLIRPAKHRGEIIQLRHERTLIDECYNSNPTALLSSLQSVMQLDETRRLVLVLGEMRELGEFSIRKHAEVGTKLAQWLEHRVASAVVIGVGTGTEALMEQLKTSNNKVTHYWVPEVSKATSLMETISQTGDLIFVKGSRGINLDKLVLHLAA